MLLNETISHEHNMKLIIFLNESRRNYPTKYHFKVVVMNVKSCY